MQTYSYSRITKSGWGLSFGPRPTHCHECGKALPIPNKGSCTTGYGNGKREPIAGHPDTPTLKQGESLVRSPAICYACCHAHDVKELLDRSKPFSAYVSSDGKTITNWPGGTLATIIASNSIRLTRLSCTHGKYIHHYHVRDVHGGLWYGRSNPGIYITLRPLKG